MADQTILDKSRHFLVESFAAGGGEAPRAEHLGSQLTQLLLVKHSNETSAAFRDDVRTFGLAFRKDNPGLRDQLMYNEASLQTVVDNGKEGLRSQQDLAERKEMRAENLQQAVGVDDIQRIPQDSDDPEGEIKGAKQPKIAGLEGIEYDTGNS